MINITAIAATVVSSVEPIAAFCQAHPFCGLYGTAGVAYAGLAHWYLRHAHRTPAILYGGISLLHAGQSWVALVAH